MTIPADQIQILREQLQSVAIFTGSLTEQEMIYEIPDQVFWEKAPLIRPDVVSYFAWLVSEKATGKIWVYCIGKKYSWTYKDDLLTHPKEDRALTPWALYPHMTEEHPTRKLTRAQWITYDIKRDGRAIVAYLKACENRQLELMLNTPVDHDAEIAEIYLRSVMKSKGLSAWDAAKHIAATWQDEPEYYPEGAIEQAKEIGIDLKSVKIPEMSPEWKMAFNNAYQKSISNHEKSRIAGNGKEIEGGGAFAAEI